MAMAAGMALYATAAVAEDNGTGDDGFEIPALEIIINRDSETAEPAPTPDTGEKPLQIAFNGVMVSGNDVLSITDDYVEMKWYASGQAESYQVQITDESGARIKNIDTDQPRYSMDRASLREGVVYTLTVRATLDRGTSDEKEVSRSARFMLYAAQTPMPEPTPEPTPEPVSEWPIDSILSGEAQPQDRPELRGDALTQAQVKDGGAGLTVPGNGAVARGQVRAITFVDRLDGAGDGAWDISAAGNGSALAWLSDGTLFIAGNGGVRAPADASYLFAGYDNLESIRFDNCFFTGDTQTMAGMFYGCDKLKTLDVGGFDTHRVTDMSDMFYGCGSLAALDLSGQNAPARFGFNNHNALVGLEGSGFDTGSVVDMRHMFAGCGALGQIVVGDSFAILGMDKGGLDGMFERCPAVIRLNGKDLDADAWREQAAITATISKGDKGEKVKWLQRILKKLGCLTGSVDGSFGDQTGKALQAFRADVGLAESDTVDRDTVRALCAAAAWVNVEKPRVGDTMAFGSYEQDGDAGNGPEAIEWIVVETDGKTATLMSLRGLGAVPYDGVAKGVTWKDASLRKRLNGDFLNAAFTTDQQKRLQNVTATAEANPVYDTQSGGEVKDKVSLPGIAQVVKWLPTEAARACLPTQRAIRDGVAVDTGTGNCPWWLRTPGSARALAVRIRADGTIDFQGAPVDAADAAIRPVISVRLVEEQKNNGKKIIDKKKDDDDDEESWGL